MTDTIAGPGTPVSGLTISSGDTLRVTAGGFATMDTVLPGGTETVAGTATAERVSFSGAVLRVAPGGIANGTQVVSGASLSVSGTVSGTVLSAGMPAPGASGAAFDTTSAVIAIGGLASATTVGSQADLAVDGIAHGIIVQSLGSVEVFGTADGITVQSGGTVAVALGAIKGTMLLGGTETVLGIEGSDAPSAIRTQVLSGGLVQLDNAGIDSGSVLSAGGRELVGAGSVAESPVIAGGTLELATSGGVGGDFTAATFSGAGGRLQIDGTAAPTGTIAGFAAGDEIVFAGLPAGMPATLSTSGNTVRLTADGVTQTLTLAGAAALPLQLVTDAATGGEAIGVACYCAGTAILTENGERPVEAIVPGDRVITADGRAEPVIWVGRRSYAGRFLAGQPHLLPVRIRAGALGEGLPRRDLLVSPCHAMALDGVLVPARLLTDGQSIVQERQAARVDYIHLELRRHDLVLAEGAASESYQDCDNRGLFANAASYRGPASAGGGCAARVTDGYALEAIRRALAAQARQAA